MNEMLKHTIFPIWILLASVQCWAQDVKASVNKTKVGLQEYVEVTYSADMSKSTGKDIEFSTPVFKNFTKVSGPNQSSSMSIVNGQMSQSKKVVYRLKPKKIGTFTLPAVLVTINEEDILTNTVDVEVVKEFSNIEEGDVLKVKEETFVRVIVSKEDVYVGEQTLVTYKLYTRSRINQVELDDSDNFSDFSVYDLPFTNDWTREINKEVYEGKYYRTTIMAQYILIPKKQGLKTLEPRTYHMDIVVPNGKKDFWGNSAGDYIPITVISPKYQIQVKKLPSKGQPDNFTGAVGQFTVENTLSNTSIELGDKLMLTQTLNGNGRLKSYHISNLNIPKGFNINQAEVSDTAYAEEQAIVGQKKNVQVLIPNKKGKYTFKVGGFNYFDPKKGKYIVIEEETVKVQVSDK